MLFILTSLVWLPLIFVGLFFLASLSLTQWLIVLGVFAALIIPTHLWVYLKVPKGKRQIAINKLWGINPIK
ncbi:hypothetical protein [Testudinibacter sp. TR-2022]|uniref:hypothetical protein n=1 Tax=Testudinibacter sp. TR-2022 TaxID=2585029 RepID=UPI00111BCD44|nr:hypothetical protein [Testudinibacter sp. TR-2022]TNH06623.1 hypothetical protein FHQ30_07190 [Pasteurellaceae bacterium Phil11]TNH25538.1 hypothetical protein FHQ29_01335 [Testudinibacter sp. TR-2022]TNH25682.1 hypothetical protein FHQ27_08760 [Testudinibacter sp. TR-2022]